MTIADPVLFFDARCTLCRMWAEWIGASGGRSLRMEDSNAEGRAGELGVKDVAQLRRRMCLLRADGDEAWGYDAVVELVRMIEGSDGVARLMAMAWARRLGWWLYDRVAQSRPCDSGG